MSPTPPRNVQDALPNQPEPAVPVGPVVPGTGPTDLGKAEGQAFVPGDVGVEMLGVVDDGTVPVPSIGDYSNPRFDTSGNLKVAGSPAAPVSAAINFTANAQTQAISLANGNSSVAVQLDTMGNGGTLRAEATADGVTWQTITGVPTASAGTGPSGIITTALSYQFACGGFAQFRLRVTAFTGPAAITGTMRAATGESLANARPVTVCNSVGTPLVSPSNGFNESAPNTLAVGLTAQFNDVAPPAITENSWGTVRMSQAGVPYAQLRDAAGNERGANVNAANELTVIASVGTAAASLGKAEDAPAASGDTGVMALAVRNDNQAVKTNNDGDYSPISVDDRGRLFVGGVVPGTNLNSLGKAESGAPNTGDTGVSVLFKGPGNAVYQNLNCMNVGDTPSIENGIMVLGIDPSLPAYRAMLMDDAGRVAVMPAVFSRTDSFVGTTNGVTLNCSVQSCSLFAIQVTAQGAVTSWSVVLEASLDNVTFTTLITHTNVAPGSGKIINTATAGFGTFPIPVLFFRARCVALVLGGGSSVDATIVGIST